MPRVTAILPSTAALSSRPKSASLRSAYEAKVGDGLVEAVLGAEVPGDGQPVP